MTPRGFFRRLTRRITRWPLYIRPDTVDGHDLGHRVTPLYGALLWFGRIPSWRSHRPSFRNRVSRPPLRAFDNSPLHNQFRSGSRGALYSSLEGDHQRRMVVPHARATLPATDDAYLVHHLHGLVGDHEDDWESQILTLSDFRGSQETLLHGTPQNSTKQCNRGQLFSLEHHFAT